MEVSSIKKSSSPKNLDVPLVRKIRRLYHIKSVPSFTYNFNRKENHSKIDNHNKDEPEIKIKRFKTHHLLKSPPLNSIKTAR